MLRQHTLGQAVSTAGIGLHTGSPVRLRLAPAPADSGVVFRRVDLDPAVAIPACSEHVGDTTLSTSLAAGGARVSSVEHLMAALAGLGIDNVRVEVDAPEIPIMDGSAAPFVRLIRAAGVRAQQAPRRFLRVLREVVIEEGDKVARFLPYAGFRVAFTIDFDHPAFRGRSAHFALDLDRDAFVREISAARTFGFMRDVEELRARGLARGGSFDNAVVVGEHSVLNRGGLRCEDEFVKHKVLDAVGDLSLLGRPLLAEYRAHKSGHALNNAAVRALLARSDAWELVTPRAAPATRAAGRARAGE